MKFLAELREGLGISWDAVRANKMRSTLATLGIVIGIVTVTLMGAAINGLNQAFIKSISALGADVFYVSHNSWLFTGTYDDWLKDLRRHPPLRLKDAEALAQQLTLTAAVAPEAQYYAGTVKYKTRSANPVGIYRHHGSLFANQRRGCGPRPVFDRCGCPRRTTGLCHRQRSGDESVPQRSPDWRPD